MLKMQKPRADSNFNPKKWIWRDWVDFFPLTVPFFNTLTSNNCNCCSCCHLVVICYNCAVGIIKWSCCMCVCVKRDKEREIPLLFVFLRFLNRLSCAVSCLVAVFGPSPWAARRIGGTSCSSGGEDDDTPQDGAGGQFNTSWALGNDFHTAVNYIVNAK